MKGSGTCERGMVVGDGFGGGEAAAQWWALRAASSPDPC